MVIEVRFSEAAERDIADLLTYLVPNAGETVARAYVDDIIDYCLGFAQFPNRGTVRDPHINLRTVGFRRRATIAFLVRDDVVMIVRVFYGGRKVAL